MRSGPLAAISSATNAANAASRLVRAQRFYAQRMGATTREIDASHVAFISRPREVVRFIRRAARAVS
jgi:hypothetical protein